MHISRWTAIRAAIWFCLVLHCGQCIKLRVLKPAHGSQTILNPRDSFEIGILIDGMQDIPGKRCHRYTLSLYNLERELYFGPLCSCWSGNGFDFTVEMGQCYINLWSGHLSSSIIELVAYITDDSGAEVAQSASRFILATRNDTLLHALIQQQAAGHGQTRLVEELRWLQALSKKEHKTFSQNTEDGAIVEVFRHFGTTNKLAVEFGAENGTEVNSRQLWEQHGWRGVLLDGDNENLSLHPNASLHQAFITPHNIASLLTKHGVPNEFDLLSVDLDYNDFWVLQRILRSFSPRIIVAEINRNFGPGESFTVPMNASLHWTGRIVQGFPHGTGYFGMSAGALDKLATSRGYTLIYVFLDAVNALLVRNDLLAPGLRELINLDVVMPEKVAGIHQPYDGAQERMPTSLCNCYVMSAIVLAYCHLPIPLCCILPLCQVRD